MFPTGGKIMSKEMTKAVKDKLTVLKEMMVTIPTDVFENCKTLQQLDNAANELIVKQIMLDEFMESSKAAKEVA